MQKSKKILLFLLSISLLVIFIHLALKYISVVIFNEQHGFMFELSNRFDLNDENSVPQWISQTLFLLSGLSALLIAYMTKDSATRRLWGVISVMAILLSLDDASTIHEFILQTIHNTYFVDTAPTFFRNAWLILLPIVLMVMLWLIISMAKLLPKKTTLILSLGGLVFIVGAIFVDSLMNNIPERSFMGQGIFGAIEGGLQLIGISILLYGLVENIEHYHANKIKATLSKLRSDA